MVKKMKMQNSNSEKIIELEEIAKKRVDSILESGKMSHLLFYKMLKVYKNEKFENILRTSSSGIGKILFTLFEKSVSQFADSSQIIECNYDDLDLLYQETEMKSAESYEVKEQENKDFVQKVLNGDPVSVLDSQFLRLVNLVLKGQEYKNWRLENHAHDDVL
eukprot:c33659_g1_i1.p1 GENE.c33659_g1_i1~~c33659_g1_i1.p1  ORF type:complete len:162 (+),score=70.25 c33659_g1_i1:161-646(+)